MGLIVFLIYLGGMMVVFGAAGDEQAKELLPEAVKRGCVCVDNSHAFRMDPTGPLVSPEINAEDIKNHNGIISNPNCATLIGLVPLYPLRRDRRPLIPTWKPIS